jgi:putative tryptophan/tyrosine transport system substrate-binding protein
MRRREFITLLGGAAAWPITAHAQKATIRIGFLFAGAAGSLTTAAQIAEINEGLHDNGMIEGRDYVLESRFAAGKYERFPDMAHELAQSGVRVILVNTIAAVRAAQRLTPPVPVVMISINDPVGTGLVTSLARPGGYTTGMATLNDDLTPKMLEFQHTIVPKAKVLGVLLNPVNPTNPPMLDDLRARAGAMGMTVHSVILRSSEELDTALSTLAAGKPDALQLLADSANLDMGDRIAAFAIEHRLPFFATWPPIVELGGLLAYGASRRKLLIRAGYYVKRILDGASPADLPVEQPTPIELWINMKTAKALGVAIPFQLQQLADRLIE